MEPPKPGKSIKTTAVEELGAPNPLKFFSSLGKVSSNLHSLKESGNIHPAIYSLGIQYAKMNVNGGNARCIALLKIINKVNISVFTT